MPSLLFIQQCLTFLVFMLHFYIGVIRPVLEYAVAVWHTDLTTDLSEQLEVIQKRALRIIFGGSSFTSQSYEPFCSQLKILPLSACRDQLATRFFHKLLHPTSCLHYLIPPKRDNLQSAKLGKTPVYDIPFARTNKFKNSFLLYALHNYL